MMLFVFTVYTGPKFVGALRLVLSPVLNKVFGSFLAFLFATGHLQQQGSSRSLSAELGDNSRKMSKMHYFQA